MRQSVLALSSILLWACVGPNDKGPAGTDDTGDGADLAVSVTLSETVATVATVSFPSEGIDEAWVEFGPTTDYGLTTPAQSASGDTFSFLLLGMRTGTEHHFRVHAVRAGRETVTSDNTVTTGDPARDLRAFEIETDGSPGVPYVLTGNVGFVPPGDIVILDADGAVVWYWNLESGTAVHPQLARSGTEILYLTDDQADLPDHTINRVSLDGTLVSSLPAPWGHHDFCELPDGQIAYIAAEARDFEGESVVGDKIVEMDTDGTVHEVWNAWDHLTPVPDARGWDYVYYEQGHDWTHVNTLVCEDDAFYISLYWTHQILKIDRANGDILWTLGGDDGDFALDPALQFGPQHGVTFVDGDIQLFDNQNGDNGGSRLLRLKLDEETWTASRVWGFDPDPAIRAGIMGDSVQFADGTTLSSWGDSGTLLRITEDGEDLWRIKAEPATVWGQIEPLDGLYAEDPVTP